MELRNSNEEPQDDLDLDRRIKEETLRRLTTEADKLAAERDEAQSRLKTPRFLQPAYLTILVGLFSVLLAGANFLYTSRKVATLEQVDKRFQDERKNSLERLAKLLKSKDSQVVASAAIQLAILYNREAIPFFRDFLAEGLANSNPMAVDDVIHGLSFVTDEQAKNEATILTLQVLNSEKPFASRSSNEMIHDRARMTLAYLGTRRAREYIRDNLQVTIPVVNGVIAWRNPRLELANRAEVDLIIGSLDSSSLLLEEHEDEETDQQLKDILKARIAADAYTGQSSVTLLAKTFIIDTYAHLRRLEVLDGLRANHEVPVRLRASEWYAGLRPSEDLSPSIRRDLESSEVSASWLVLAPYFNPQDSMLRPLYIPPFPKLIDAFPEYDRVFRNLRLTDQFRRRYLALAMVKEPSATCKLTTMYPELTAVCGNKAFSPAPAPDGRLRVRR